MMKTIRTTLGVLAMLCMLATGVIWAQETTDQAPPYPAGLDDPAIALDELELRLIPLTLDQLEPLVKAWQKTARAASQAIVDKVLDIRATDEPEAEALREERLALLEERDRVFENFSAVIAGFEAKGADPAEVTALREYMSAITQQERSQLTLQEFADSLMQWFAAPDGGVKLGLQIAIAVGAWFGLLIVARIARAWTRRTVDRMPHLSNLLSGFLVMVVYWLTIAFGLMIVLAALGVNITPLFALVGGASFIIAFALQETLGNLAAGLMIMINRPFDEGDYVLVAGLGGTVKHVSVVSTTITTPDNQVIIIPNSKVWGDVITNVTASETRRIDLVFGIGYNDSIEQAQQVLEDVIASHPLVLKDPAPIIRVSELGESSVNFIVRPWTKTSDYWSTYWDLQRAVKEAFDANGISIPFPQTDMHLHLPDSDTAARPAMISALGGTSAADKDSVSTSISTGKGAGAGTSVSTSYASGDESGAEPDEGDSARG